MQKAKKLAILLYRLGDMGSGDIPRNITMANKLLERYDYEDLEDAIVYYTKTKPPESGPMQSMHYLNYVIEDFVKEKRRRLQIKEKKQKQDEELEKVGWIKVDNKDKLGDKLLFRESDYSSSFAIPKEYDRDSSRRD